MTSELDVDKASKVPCSVHHRAGPVRDPVALAIITAATDRLCATGLPPAVPHAVPPPLRRSRLVSVVAAALIVAVAVAAASAASAGEVDAGCRPIAYHLVFDRGPREAPQILRSVFDEMETLTGLRFVPADTGGDGDVPVRIAWVRDPDAGPWNAGELGRTTVAWDHRDGWTTIRAGQILFRSSAEAERIEAGPVDWHTLARHEMGHLLGLPHWPDPRSVMHPTLTPHPQTWAKQQHALLTAAGRDAGCRPPGWETS